MQASLQLLRNERQYTAFLLKHVIPITTATTSVMTDKIFSTYYYENHRNYAAKMTNNKQRNTQAKPRYHDQGTMTEPPYPYIRLNVCRTVAIVAWTIWLLHAMYDQFRGSLRDYLFIPAGVCGILFFILGVQLPGDIDTDNLFIQSLWAGTFHFVVLTITEWLSNCFIYDFPKSWALGTRICWSLVWMWSCCVVWGWIVAIGPQDEEDIKVPLWMEDFLPHGIAKLIKNKK